MHRRLRARGGGRIDEQAKWDALAGALAAQGARALAELPPGLARLPRTVVPLLVDSPLGLDGLRRLRLTRLRVERVEPARLEPPAADSNAPNTYALGPLLWALAMNGARSELLPEIAGPVAYRIAPAANLAGLHRLEQGATLAAAVARLQRHTTALVDIEGWPGFHRERAQRLVNGLYLNAALMVSRTHPAAINEQGRRHRAA